MSTSAVVVQLISAIGASGLITGLITWLSGRRRSNADAAKIWGELIETQIESGKKQRRELKATLKLQRDKSDALVTLCWHLVDDLEAGGIPHVDERRAELRRIERMDEDVEIL